MKNFFKDRSIALAAAWSFNQLAYAIVYPFIPIYLGSERGFSYSLIGLIFPMMGAAVILAPIPCGWMTDKMGRSFMMLSGQLGRGVLFFILAAMVYWEAPFWVLAVVLMMNTAVGVVFQVGADAYLADVSTEEERPGFYSKIRMGFNVGWSCGPMLGAFFAQTPFWFFFIITGVLCLLGTVFTYFTCCRHIVPHRSRKEKIRHTESIFSILSKRPDFLLLLAGALALYSLTSQLYSTMSLYSTVKVGISKEALGSIYSLNGFMVLCLQIPLTALVVRCKCSILTQLLMGAGLYGAGYFLLGPCTAAWMIACAVVIITFGEIIIQPALYSAVSRGAVPENAGRLMASYSMIRGIGYSVGPWFGTLLMERISSGMLLWSSLTLFAVAAMFFFTLAIRRGKNLPAA